MVLYNFVCFPSRVLFRQLSQNVFKTSIPRQEYNAQSLYEQILINKRRLHISAGLLRNTNGTLTSNLVRSPPHRQLLNKENDCKNLIKKYDNQIGCQSQQRYFRTTPPNQIAPQILLVLSRVAKYGAAFLGRTIRKWWTALPPEEKAVHTQRLRRNSKYFFALCGAALFGLFVYHEQHLEETPITQRKRFVAFNSKQFDQIAKLEFQEMLVTYKDQIVPASLRDPQYRRVSKIAHRLLNANKDLEQIKRKEWTITLVNDDNIQNAFVLPCGNIFVFTGMLNICESDDELAVILAHEMAHSVLSHGAENASYLHLMDLLLVIPVAVLWAVLPTDATAVFFHWVGGSLQNILLNLPYAREMEKEADTVGLHLASKACFDIRVAPVFWAKMGLVNEKDGFPQIEFLSTHPSHDSRQSQLEEAMADALTVREKCQCPPLPFFDAKKLLEDYKKKVDMATNYDNVAIRLRV